MTFIAFLAAAYRRLNVFFSERATHKELSKLNDQLLRDIGVRLENGRVYTVADYNGNEITTGSGFSLDERERDG